MNMGLKCQRCNGSGKRQLSVGDIVTPRDGSGFPNGLHSILFQGTGENFKPVRVLSIQGNMLGVVPVHWDDKEIRHTELFGKEGRAYQASNWIWVNGKSVTEYGFWIDVTVSHLTEEVK